MDHTGHSHTSDLVLVRNGKEVRPGDDRGLYSNFLRNASAAGFSGIGHYDWGVHIGGGSEAAWGPDTSSRTLDPEFGAAIEQGRKERSGAWAKSTLYGIHHFDVQTFVLVMGELVFGMATYALRSTSQLATADGQDRYWEATMDPANLIKNGWARSATASILPMLLDTGLSATPLGPQFGNARASGQATDAVFGSPVVSSVNEVAGFVKGAGESVAEGREMTPAEMRKGFRSLPFANWMPLMGVFEKMIEDR